MALLGTVGATANSAANSTVASSCCSARWILGTVLGLGLLGCGSATLRPSGGNVQMKVVSNVENSTFRYRARDASFGAEEGWIDIANVDPRTGSFSAPGNLPIRIQARAPDGRTKEIELHEPVTYPYEITFLSSHIASSGGASAPRAAENVDLPAPTGRTLAVVVGISEYRGNEASLPNAVKDAEAIRKSLLEIGVRPEYIFFLPDDKATKAGIFKALEEVVNRSNPGDMIFFYFAGHGTPVQQADAARYLIPYDGSSNDASATGIEQEEIVSRLDGEKSVRKDVGAYQMVVMDCCFAGEAVRGATIGEKDVWSNLGRKPGRVVLTATSGDQVAQDGKFAQCFVEALEHGKELDKNGDGLSVSELYSWVAEEVRARSGATMSPQLYGADWADRVKLTKPVGDG